MRIPPPPPRRLPKGCDSRSEVGDGPRLPTVSLNKVRASSGRHAAQGGLQPPWVQQQAGLGGGILPGRFPRTRF